MVIEEKRQKTHNTNITNKEVQLIQTLGTLKHDFVNSFMIIHDNIFQNIYEKDKFFKKYKLPKLP